MKRARRVLRLLGYLCSLSAIGLLFSEQPQPLLGKPAWQVVICVAMALIALERLWDE